MMEILKTGNLGNYVFKKQKSCSLTPRFHLQNLPKIQQYFYTQSCLLGVLCKLIMRLYKVDYSGGIKSDTKIAEGKKTTNRVA